VEQKLEKDCSGGRISPFDLVHNRDLRRARMRKKRAVHPSFEIDAVSSSVGYTPSSPGMKCVDSECSERDDESVGLHGMIDLQREKTESVRRPFWWQLTYMI